MSDSPSTVVNKLAQNPMGASSSMAGTTGAFNPPNADMHTTKNIYIDPTSCCMGAKKVES